MLAVPPKIFWNVRLWISKTGFLTNLTNPYLCTSFVRVLDFKFPRNIFSNLMNYDKYLWFRIWGRTSSSPYLLLISSLQRGISGTRQPQRHWISVRYTILDISQVYYTGYQSGILYWISVRYTILDISQVYYTGYQSGILYSISSPQRGIFGTRQLQRHWISDIVKSLNSELCYIVSLDFWRKFEISIFHIDRTGWPVYIAVCFWHLVKRDLSSVHTLASRSTGTITARPCLFGRAVIKR